jgi:hypothetical protein
MAAPALAAPNAQPAPTTSWAPTAKVAVGTLAGAVTLIMLQILRHFYNYTPSAEVGGAITTLVTFVIQYMTPERK